MNIRWLSGLLSPVNFFQSNKCNREGIMSQLLIGIHGLANKPTASVLAKGWEDSICEGLSKNEGVDHVKLNFSSVYWADEMYKEPDKTPDLYIEADVGTIKTYKDSWMDSVREKTFDWTGDIIDSIKKNFGVDALADRVLKIKFKDLSAYYENTEIRNILRKKLKDEILANQDKRMMILAHSMGSIIAYDVLRAIGKEHPRLIIDHFVTLGSPLGAPHIKYKIALENPLLRTPSIVKRWTNFADRRDPVAIDTHLSGDFEENGSGVSVEDNLVSNDWAGIHHKAYGYLRTPEVSKIIKNFI